MRYYAYHRTSTREQHLDRGIREIENFCKDQNIVLEKKVFTDQQTGKNYDRARYIVLTEDVLSEGDALIITELDRLGRTKQGILKELQKLKEHGIRVMVLEIPTTLMNFSSLGNELARLMMETINNMLIEMYASLAQAEMEKKEKRQREGIDAKKARGDWDDYGRPRTMKLEKFGHAYQAVLSGEKRPFELKKELNLTTATFYRYKKEWEMRQEEN